MNAPTQIMQKRIQAALQIPDIYEGTRSGYARTFQALGMERQEAKKLAYDIIRLLMGTDDIVNTEADIYARLQIIQVDGVSLTDIISQKMSQRAETVFEQISPYFEKFQPADNVLDFGCGNGLVAQFMADRMSLNMFGCDASKYLAANVTVPILGMTDCRVDCEDGVFAGCVMTNVLHHETQNQKILVELERIMMMGGRLVVIETIPLQNTVECSGITFLSDYLFNRLFHQADVPVPGAYEREDEWTHRFERMGFTLENLSGFDKGFRNNPEALGIDHPLNWDWHVRYVFKKVE